jgi:hypothetical protein
MVEVNGVMTHLHRHCQGVPLMMGAATHPQVTDGLLVGLLVAHPDDSEDAPAAPDEAAAAPPAARSTPADLGVQLLDPSAAAARSHSRFIPPPPEMSPEKLAQLRARQGAGAGRRKAPRLRQTTLPLEIISKGRFDQSEPTIHKGEDLDVPTYIRRGIALN